MTNAKVKKNPVGRPRKDRTIVISKRVPFVYKTEIIKAVDKAICSTIKILNK